MVNFENTIIIMTSNAGSDLKTANYGFNKTEAENIKNNVDNALKNTFRPEFLNRVDDVVIFDKLSKETQLKIIDLMLNELAAELFARDIIFTVDNNVKEHILKIGYDEKYGARPLRRTIEKFIQNKIAELLIKGDIQKHTKITVVLENDYLDIKIEK